MIALSMIVVVLASLLHAYIFLLETFFWQSDSARKTFKTTETFAKLTKEMAANQGVYNLLLAGIGIVGAVLVGFGARDVGAALAFAACGSMALAALYLFVTAKDKRSAAVKQGTLPLLALVFLVLSTAR